MKKITTPYYGVNAEGNNMQLKHIKLEDVITDLEAHPDKRIFWRSGFRWKGARESEIARNQQPGTKDWKEVLKDEYHWACVVECTENTDTEMHLNGFGECDMF